MIELKLRIGKEITGLQFATFTTKYELNASELKNYTNKKTATRGNGVSEIQVQQFRNNVSETVDNDLTVGTNYHTYLFNESGNVIGYFSGNIAPIGLDDVIENVSLTNVDYPNPLTVSFDLMSEIDLEYKLILTKNPLSETERSNVDLYSSLETFNPPNLVDTSVNYSVSFERLTFDHEYNQFPFLSETEDYHLYLYTQNLHGAVRVIESNIDKTSSVSAPTFDFFDCLSMGNLEDPNNIRLEMEFSTSPPDRTARYYIAAYPENGSAENLLQLTQEGNVGDVQGNIVVTLNALAGDQSSFQRDIDVTVMALLVDQETGAFLEDPHTLTLTLDIPMITDLIAAPVLNI